MKQYHLKRYPGLFYVFKGGRKKYGYRYTYYDKLHKRHEISRRNYDSSQAAIHHLKHVRFMTHRNHQFNPNLTIGEWVKSFIQANHFHWKLSTYDTYVTIFRDFILPYLAKVKVTKLNKSIYQRKCINPLIKRGLKHSSIIDIHHRMVTLMNSAVDNDIVNRNKIRGTQIPAAAGKICKRIMTYSELTKFNQQLDHEPIVYQVIFKTLQDTGMREGELLGLKWRDIDLKHLKISIAHTRDGYGYRSPKTPHSKRIIGISRHLARLLSRYHQLQSQTFAKYCHHLTNKDFLITNHWARPLSNTSISRNLKKILRRAGLGYLAGHFTAHTFRHMFASYLLNHGIPLTDVSHALGHANPQITLSIYTERNPASSKNLGHQIENIYRNQNKNKSRGN